MIVVAKCWQAYWASPYNTLAYRLPASHDNQHGMNPNRITTQKELLLLTTFLALCATAFTRGGTLEVRLALATCATCTFFVSLHASPPFRSTYLTTFGIVLLLIVLDAALRVDVVKYIYVQIRSVMLRSGYDEYRLTIFRVILLLSLSYLAARLRVAIRRPSESVGPSRSSQ